MTPLLRWVRAALLLHLLSGVFSAPSFAVLGAYVPSTVALPDLYEASLSDLQAGLTAGQFSSVELVKAYFARIEEVNLNGPELRAIIETNPSALAQAAVLDRERKTVGPRGPLHGIPILVKDNVATVADEGMNTTAGSWALYKSVVPDDAGVVKRLRKAGAIILGEYFDTIDVKQTFLSGPTLAETSPQVGLVGEGSPRVPTIQAEIHVAHREALQFQLQLGLHRWPSARKPTEVLPAQRAITILSESSPLLASLRAQEGDVGLRKNARAERERRGGRALETLRELGATVVDPADIPSAREMIEAGTEAVVTRADLKVQLNEWFDSLISNPSGVSSVADLIKFNKENPSLESPEGYADQSILTAAQKTEGLNSTYYEALARNHEMGRERGIDAALKQYALDALVLPAKGFDYVTKPSAIAGYPIVTVPLGFYPDNTTIVSAGPVTFYPAPGIPIGLAFLGTAWSEYDLIGYAYAYEQKTQTRLQRMAYDGAIPRTQIMDVLEGASKAIFDVVI
ncbi:hypothetical protein CONPUDRAFT_78321 [Coniophora puteana RWD-64-598 SS2]|uniref:Amidase domain-containing protein n=1 Tax=Coniophora puteana (strain RWD-64-598) TaxID=741705 RepID=R7SD11_CONPW|nr:uncharacterized protein CONPUDRAFT_78321 [Coniophora puteana RWD-64-598 SS2]EIW74053.1 hypothetical protein CONPUDRAFT_78321 [Coniophora puteana RWD-64-598 SS2]